MANFRTPTLPTITPSVSDVLQLWPLLYLVHPPLERSVVSSFFISHSFPSFTRSFIHLHVQEVRRGFPDEKFIPTHAVVATWENVAAYEEQARASGASNRVRRTKLLTLLTFVQILPPTSGLWCSGDTLSQIPVNGVSFVLILRWEVYNPHLSPPNLPLNLF